MVRWESGRRSENVEDRRFDKRGLALGGGGASILMLIIVFVLTGGDLGKVLQFAQKQAQQAPVQQEPGERQVDPAEEELVEFVKVILADTEDVWTELLGRNDVEYRKPTLVLFRGVVQSGCGGASASSGPFYCPADEKLYIDLEFYEQLRDQLSAPGDFAQAYVIAHEVGHHVQKILGLTTKVHTLQQQVSETEANDLSVRLELQADFLAGVWAHHADKARNILESGDIAEGLNAAAMIGDDTLQRRAGSAVVEESFTHGSSEQRVRWFKKGFQTGDLSQMDTFSASSL